MEISRTYAPSKTGLLFHQAKKYFKRGVIGVPGCFDRDTEVLTPSGWVKVCDWAGERILCYDKDTRRSFFDDVTPVKLPMAPGETFNYVKSRSLDMMLSDEHTVLFSFSADEDTYRTLSMREIVEINQREKNGFTGFIPSMNGCFFRFNEGGKPNIEFVPSVDGYKYCFTTNTGFFLARRNGRTFITGNSGKSVMCIQELLWIGYNQAPDQNGVRNTRFAIIRATYPNLRSTTVKTYQQWVPPLIAPVKQTAPMTSTLRMGLPDGTSCNMEFVFIAVENEVDAEKLKSLELTAAFVNEASEVDISVIDMLETRVGRYPSEMEGGCSYSGIIFDSNPPADTHWIAQLDKQIQQGVVDGVKIFHQPAPFIPVRSPTGAVVDYEENPEAENLEYLNQQPPVDGRPWTLEERRQFGYEYYRRQMSGKSQHWIDVFILGRYGSSFNGKPVYQEHWTESVVSEHQLEPTYGEPVILGADTTGLNPSVVFGQIKLGVLRINHELLALDMPFEPFVRDVLRPFIAQHYPNSQVICYTDPANPRDSNRGETPVMVLRKYGIMAQNAPSNKFQARYDSVVSFLQRREGFLIDPRCEKIIDGFRGGYCYRPLRISGVGQAYSSEPTKNEYSHVHDALQYLCLGIRKGRDQQDDRPRPQIARSKRVY